MGRRTSADLITNIQAATRTRRRSWSRVGTALLSGGVEDTDPIRAPLRLSCVSPTAAATQLGEKLRIMHFVRRHTNAAFLIASRKSDSWFVCEAAVARDRLDRRTLPPGGFDWISGAPVPECGGLRSGALLFAVPGERCRGR
jgi:hypothetical protein